MPLKDGYQSKHQRKKLLQLQYKIIAFSNCLGVFKLIIRVINKVFNFEGNRQIIEATYKQECE